MCGLAILVSAGKKSTTDATTSSVFILITSFKMIHVELNNCEIFSLFNIFNRPDLVSPRFRSNLHSNERCSTQAFLDLRQVRKVLFLIFFFFLVFS